MEDTNYKTYRAEAGVDQSDYHRLVNHACRKAAFKMMIPARPHARGSSPGLRLPAEMMVTFICSCRNKNKPTATYALGT